MLVRLRGLIPKDGVRGEVFYYPHAVSFLGDLDPERGLLGGVSIASKILVIKGLKGSTVGPYVLYSLSRRGLAPAAIVSYSVDLMLTVSCAIAGVPLYEVIDKSVEPPICYGEIRESELRCLGDELRR